MIDLHSHVLFGIDDGASTFDMTELMLNQAVTAGITELVATPHVNRHTTSETEQLIRETFNEIEKYAVGQVIPLKLHLAAEVHITADHIHLAGEEWPLLGINQKYMLVELPLRGIPETISQIVFDLGLRKVNTILAHPERNNHLQSHPELLIKWYNQGCVLQMDAGSITGQFGQECRDFSWRLLKAGLVHCIASDAHNDTSRSVLLLRDARLLLEKRLDNEYIQALFEGNPEKILHGRRLNNPMIDSTRLEEGFLRKMMRMIKYGM